MNNKWTFQFFLAVLPLLISCTKEDAFYDEDLPVIKILSPVGQDVFTAGDTIDIHVEIVDNDELHEIMALLLAESMGQEEVVWEMATHTHQASYDLYYRLIVPQRINPMEYKFEVEASDHHNNIGKKTLIFQAL